MKEIIETVYSMDGETYHDLPISELIDDAINTGDIDPMFDDVLTIYKAQSKSLLASDLLYPVNDQLLDAAYDQYGDFAEDWLDGITTDAQIELNNALKLVLDGWATKHNQHPTFLEISDAKEIKVKVIEGGYEVLS